MFIFVKIVCTCLPPVNVLNIGRSIASLCDADANANAYDDVCFVVFFVFYFLCFFVEHFAGICIWFEVWLRASFRICKIANYEMRKYY